MSEHKNKDMETEKAPPPTDNVIETQHTVTVNGEEINYTVHTGTIVLKEETEEEGAKAKATIFFVAYSKNDANKYTRPITFSFNGGPGSSSVWLHLGLLGPRRVVMGDDAGNPTPPPYELVDNDYTMLDKTDLVFIDPVTTGFSRPVPGEKATEFLTFKKDIESVGDFIRLYCSRYHRWASPKFLIGESYGTTRAAGLAGYLQERHGMYLNGIFLISSVLDFSTIRFTLGNDLPYILFLPTYAATAWHYKKLSPALQNKKLNQVLTEVEEFALGDYTLALMQGSELPARKSGQIARKVARMTGLSPEFVENANLRVDIFRFVKELLRNERLTVGRLDSRFTGQDRDAAGEHFEYDPSYASILGCYTSTLNHYIHHDLKFESDLPYEILNFQTNKDWKFNEHQNQSVNVADTLRKAIANNPHLQIFVASGYFDLATPYMATQYTLNHMNLEKNQQRNITHRLYRAGHMMYVEKTSLERLKRDMDRFMSST